jgi:hypothetical protein
VNFGERGKSSGRHWWTLEWQGSLTILGPWVGPTSVFISQLGSLGWVSEFFEVRTQVDRGLTTIDHLTGYYG